MTTPQQPPHEAQSVVSEEAPDGAATLDELLARPVVRRESAVFGAACLVAECVDDRHPTLQGRVRVRFVDASGHAQETWVPTFQGLAVRVADRVLMVQPANGDEWIVTGVVDGFASRPRVDKLPAARLELKHDESLQVVSREGRPLVEISQRPEGPVVRLLEPDVHVEFAGKLALSAEDIQLEATRGQVRIKASEDVVVVGEIVRLN